MHGLYGKDIIEGWTITLPSN